MKNQYIFMLLACLGFAACKKLDQQPESTASKQAVFGTENGLKLYTNSFYGMDFLPKNSTSQDAMSDYLAVRQVPDFIREGAFGANNSSGWTWRDLRNINYFIQNCNDPAVPVAVRNNYIGIARYFRAYFYMEKVKRFGDVPWINKPLDIDDPSLNAGRDKRELVMDSVLADINFACANIQTTNDASRTTITKWVVYAYKSRICLFEGTFRKYHTELNLVATANKWLEEASSSADEIIKKGGFSLNTAGGAGVSYRQVFISNTPIANEVLQSEVLLNYAEAKAELGTFTDADWALTIGALRSRAGITGGLSSKPTIANPYLMTNYFPGISDPSLLEIRRERGIELSLEGGRFSDLLRWKRGSLMEQEWNGFYVPALNTPLDLNEDGILDVAFYQGTRPTPGAAGVTYVDVSSTVGSATNSQLLKNGNSGELTWMKEIPRKWSDKNYYYPIPLNDLQRNPNLKQNAGWQ